MGAAVQFVGKNAVTMAFEKRSITKWALLSGKSIMVAYEGSDDEESGKEFDEWLTMMRGNTTAIYTVRFYDKSVKTIRPDTAEVGSFNFRLSEETPYQGGQMNGAGVTDSMERFFNKLTSRLDEMDKKIAGISLPKEDPEKMETWEKLLEHPVVMAGVAKIFDIDIQGILTDSAKLSGIPGEPVELDTVMEGLRKHNPKIEQHLKKLLQIAERKPQQFQMLISMLDKMAI